MKKNLLFAVVMTLITVIRLNGQTPIDVAENTLKVNPLAEEVFYYGFAEGDQLIFSFQEVNGKELKEIELIELPSSSKFMDYKSKKIENKVIHITKNCIYKFRFANGAIVGRICKFKIQRIPASEASKNFNTSVYWRTVYDTTYTTEQQRYLVKSDTIISNLTDQVAKVHSQTNGNTTTTNFELPKNTVAWSYYIDVDQAGREAFQQAVTEVAKNAEPFVSKIPGYGPMAVLALGGASYLSKAQGSESIQYSILDSYNRYIKTGTVVNDFAHMASPLEGQYYFYLVNQNVFKALDVTLKVTAIVVNNDWGTRPIQKMHVTSKQEAYLN